MIDPEEITKIVKDCLFNEDEIENGKPKDGVEPVIAEGIISTFGFHPDRIKGYKKRIGEILSELPKEFMSKSSGGSDGWSFLNACNDKDGKQWGEHRNMDELVCLGLATSQVSFNMPRTMWRTLPGGMPYFVVTLLIKEKV